VIVSRTFERIRSDVSPWTCKTLERVVVAFVAEAVLGGVGRGVERGARLA